MLIQRVITAAILAPLVILAVFKFPIDIFALTFALVIFLAGWEWSRLIGIQTVFKQALFFLGMIVFMLWFHFWTQFLEALQYLIETGQQDLYQHAKKSGWTSVSSFMENLDIPDVRAYSGILEALVIPPVIFWVIVMLTLRNAPASALKLELKRHHKAFMGGFVLVTAWVFFVRLRVLYGPEMVAYLLVLIWAADIAAYFVGKKWGSTKLAPEISPGKTLAGFYGALVSALVCGVILGVYYGFQFIIGSDMVLLSMITVLVSIYGDLFFSLIKRQGGVKDSSNLLPGHGGILDRVDSLIAAIPIFYAGIYLLYRLIE